MVRALGEIARLNSTGRIGYRLGAELIQLYARTRLGRCLLSTPPLPGQAFHNAAVHEYDSLSRVS